MLNWTPALSVGVPDLDAQHQELFRRADAFLEGLGACSPAEVSHLLDFLGEHARLHFAAEEAWMREGAYTGLEGHRAEHQRFLEDLADLRRPGAGARPAIEVASWLVRWLHDHVLRADGAAARSLQEAAGGPARGSRP